MKYVESFSNLYEKKSAKELLADKTKKAAKQAINAESLIRSFFSLFTDVSAIKQIWSARKEEKELMNLTIDIYNHLIDVEDIMDLPKSAQIKYAKNLGLDLDDDDILISEIAKQLYVQNYKRDLEEDMDTIIKYLEEDSKFQSLKDAHKIFLDKIKELKEIIF